MATQDQQNLANLIDEYSQLDLYKDRVEAQGKRVPPHVAERMNQISNAVEGDYGSEMMPEIGEYVTHRKAQYQQRDVEQRKINDRQRLDKDIAGITRHMTPDGKGMTAEQYAQAKQHRQYVQKADTRNTDYVNHVKDVFKKGGADVEANLEASEEVLNKIRSGEREQADKLMEKYNLSIDEVHAAGTHGAVYEVAKRLAENEDTEDEIIDISDQDDRRIDIYSSIAWGGDGTQTPMEDEIHESYTERDEDGDDIRADVAEAFIAHGEG
ncbi:MAG: hypothetical protein V7708_02810 [Oceanicoccus sp.]